MSDPGSPPPVDPESNPPHQPNSTRGQPYGVPGQPFDAAQPQSGYAASAPSAPFTAEQDKQTAMFAHLGGVVAFLAFFTGWLSLLAIVPALVIYLVFRRRGRLTEQESKEALNFQITMVAAMIIWAIVAIIVTLALTFSLGYGTVLLVLLLLAVIGWALVIIDVIFSIVAAVRVNNGGTYRYPFAVRFIK